ncbi:MAG TPA: hypothetical protein VE591_12060 [Candidatus Acidoferrum sp.]|nr:hypothetical protein [Candidatus Acidoferrum sp.]
MFITPKALIAARPLVFGLAAFAATGTAAFAQDAGAGNATFDPTYNTYNHWSSAWNHGQYDHRHVLIGTVASFQPYRLLLSRPNGPSIQVDLKNGTVIRPAGTNLAPGERVAVTGYWSKGTFIANRVILRS